MPGAYVAGRVAAKLVDHGETWTLTRIGSTDTSITVKGKRFGATAEAVVNNASRTTIKVLISNAEIVAGQWPGPLRKNDILVDAASRTWKVEAVDTRKDGETTVGHFLTVTSG